MNLNDELINSAQNGDLAKLKKCITKGANINASDENGETALTQACDSGHYDIVKFLAENGADTNARNDVGYGALEFSASNEIWEYLKPKASSVDKDLALINFAMRGNVEQVKSLVAQGADINATDSTGWTALMFAARDGHFEVVKLLLANGANINATTHKGNINALYLAQTKEIAQILQEYGAKPPQ